MIVKAARHRQDPEPIEKPEIINRKDEEIEILKALPSGAEVKLLSMMRLTSDELATTKLFDTKMKLFKVADNGEKMIVQFGFLQYNAPYYFLTCTEIDVYKKLTKS